MKTEIEIDTITKEFALWLLEEYNIGLEPADNLEHVGRTAEPVQNFIDACRTIKRIKHDTMNGMAVTILEEAQRHAGERRIDIYLLDVEDSVRLVYY
jgi:hypothetical protein